jgi:hypothetical protein
MGEDVSFEINKATFGLLVQAGRAKHNFKMSLWAFISIFLGEITFWVSTLDHRRYLRQIGSLWDKKSVMVGHSPQTFLLRKLFTIFRM